VRMTWEYGRLGRGPYVTERFSGMSQIEVTWFHFMQHNLPSDGSIQGGSRRKNIDHQEGARKGVLWLCQEGV
jgi:hypothetical protein